MNYLQIKALRERLQINIREMATRSRIPFSTYRDIEDGRVLPTRNQLERIQQVFERYQAHDKKRLAKWNAAVGETGGEG